VAPPPTTGATPHPSASPTFDAKPGGTLRIVGVERRVSLDPASPTAEPSPAADLSGASAADGARLVGRLVLRQLYSYPPVDPVHDQPDPDATTGPAPDLAADPPKLSDGGRTATISLRSARWDVPNPRRVTANDALRALKRLCLPAISSPVRGFLDESVVGYADACSTLARYPPRTLADLDAIDIPGLATQGDTALVIKLIRPTNDLTAMLAMPETSPLPVESFQASPNGLAVTNDPLRFVGDGPYRFVQPQAGESYALSRSPSWGSDPLRRAYVDHVSIRGGLTVAQVGGLIENGGADLTLDVPAAALSTGAGTGFAADGLVSTPAQATALLAVGARGPQAQRLRMPAVRRAIAACIDPAARKRIAEALGPAAAASDDLLAGLSLLPAGTRSPAPGPTSGSASASRAATPTASTPTASTPAGSTTAGSTTPAIPAAQCVPTFGVAGTALRLLTVDAAPTRAAAAIIVERLAAAGVHVSIEAAAPARYASAARTGGWDLLLAVRPVHFPAPRALLAPLLDPRWPADHATALLRSSRSIGQLLAATAETEREATTKAWTALRTVLASTASILPLAEVQGLYPTGANVASAPVIATAANADPTNVSLGSTRPAEPARSPTATP
jgi:ABC-type transport system substrate-binding protein